MHRDAQDGAQSWHKKETEKWEQNKKKKTKEKKTSRQLKPSPHGAEKFTYIWA
jgi:hypothetical protein